MTGPSRPVAFLDRDGTLVEERHYLSDPAAVVLLPGAAAAIRAIQEAGLAVVVVTNQSGIARGYYTEADYRKVAERVDELLGLEGVRVAATYHCPHLPEVTGPCDCRKPGPGMYLRAARELGVQPTGAFFVGDRWKDVLPALAFQGTGFLVRTGYGMEEAEAPPDPVPVYLHQAPGHLPRLEILDSLSEVAREIVARVR